MEKRTVPYISDSQRNEISDLAQLIVIHQLLTVLQLAVLLFTHTYYFRIELNVELASSQPRYA